MLVKSKKQIFVASKIDRPEEKESGYQGLRIFPHMVPRPATEEYPLNDWVVETRVEVMRVSFVLAFIQSDKRYG